MTTWEEYSIVVVYLTRIVSTVTHRRPICYAISRRIQQQEEPNSLIFLLLLITPFQKQNKRNVDKTLTKSVQAQTPLIFHSVSTLLLTIPGSNESLC
jgi:hypothetical protein